MLEFLVRHFQRIHDDKRALHLFMAWLATILAMLTLAFGVFF